MWSMLLFTAVLVIKIRLCEDNRNWMMLALNPWWDASLVPICPENVKLICIICIVMYAIKPQISKWMPFTPILFFCQQKGQYMNQVHLPFDFNWTAQYIECLILKLSASCIFKVASLDVLDAGSVGMISFETIKVDRAFRSKHQHFASVHLSFNFTMSSLLQSKYTNIS